MASGRLVIPGAAWLSAAEADVPAGDGWLSPAERAVAATLRTPRRRRDWRLGRWTARRAVGAVLGTDPAGVEVLAADGEPPRAWLRGRPAPVSISISHRSGLAVCLVTSPGSRPGVDLELVEPLAPVFARDYFTPEELTLLQRAGPGEHDLAVTLVWSAKESALKALGQGLRLDTRSVMVAFDLRAAPRLGWRPLAVRHASVAFAGWWRHLDGHVLTVVTEPPTGVPARVRP